MESNFADGWSDPAWHHAGVSGLRTRAAAHTRPCLSMAKLWTVVWLFQIFSSPQNGDGAMGGVSPELGVPGSRTISFIWLVAVCVGSTEVRYSPLSSSAPYIA